MGIAAKGVTAGYGGAPVVLGVDLEVNAGELVAVVGPNGSGKTTLLRALAGTLPPEAGDIRVGGRPLAGLSAPERACRVALVPQSAPFEFAFTVREVVETGRTAHLSRLGSLAGADRKAVQEALDRVGLADLGERNSTAVSSGQAQLVVLARALAQGTNVLLLDEPTAHLDVAHQIEVMDCVRRLVKEGGLAAVAVVHDLNLAATYADRLVLLAKGRVRAQGTPAAVLTRANVAATFGLDVLIRRHPVSGAFFVVPLSLATAEAPRGATGQGRARVHLVCGGGTGAPLMHALVRAGFDVSVGVVNVLDTDFEVAEALGLRVVAEAPFSPVSPASLEEARGLAGAADAVVLAAVPLGRSNADNLSLLDAALSAGKRVAVMDADHVPARDFTGGEAAARVAGLLAAQPPGAAGAYPSPEALLAALHDLFPAGAMPAPAQAL